MKKCCHEAFKRALEEVIFQIDFNKPTIENLREALIYSVSMLEGVDHYATDE
jgi:hypothetical protein